MSNHHNHTDCPEDCARLNAVTDPVTDRTVWVCLDCGSMPCNACQVDLNRCNGEESPEADRRRAMFFGCTCEMSADELDEVAEHFNRHND